MFFGSFYYEIPKSLPQLDITSIYYVVFLFLVFCFARFFNSYIKTTAICLANTLFLFSFGINCLVVAAVMALYTFFSALVLTKKKNKAFLLLLIIPEIAYLILAKYQFINSIVMSIGLSFYTFKNISYLIDIYRRDIKVVTNPFKYYAYSCFFACLIAGPINRAGSFFKELDKYEEFDYVDSKNGGIQVLLGIFEKIVICDYIKEIAEILLGNNALYGYFVLLGVLLYSLAIYLDFDSYSNIAIGSARLMGFHLDKNFKSPYLAINLKDFWNRWHISLTTWLRDYLYIPLGGNIHGSFRKYLNIIIVFLVSGIWHGGTLNFIIWGFLHGIIRIVEEVLEKPFKKLEINNYLKKLFSLSRLIINYIIVSFLWIVFKYSDIGEISNIFRRLFIYNCFDLKALGLSINELAWLSVLLIIVVLSDILRDRFDMLMVISKQFILIRWLFYFILIVVFLIFGVYGGSYDPNDFIYKWF